MDFVQTEEGRAIKSGTNWNYEYTLTDHLGNSRVNIDSYNGAVRVTQEDEYYPFGLDRQRYTNGIKNKYLYNKKEVQEELGQYDYGARFYDPVIARWGSVDPLAEMERRASPYNYTFDDPIRHTDPDGMFGEDFNDDNSDDGPGPRTAVKVTAGGILGGGMAAAGAIAVGGLATGPGEAIALPAAGVVALGTLAGAGTAWVLDKIFSPHNTLEPVNTIQSQQSQAKDVGNSMLMAKGKRRADAEHTQNQQEKNRNTHEEARARKDREQKKADERSEKTKSQKEDERSNNQKKKDDSNYKKANDPKKNEPENGSH